MSSLKIFDQFTAEFLRDKHRDELFLEWQPEQTNYLVIGSPLEKRILMYDRQNKQIRDIPLASPCSHLAWSRHGLFLSLACAKGQNTVIYVWSPGNQKLMPENLDAGDLGKVTWMGWCTTADVLAVAFSTGNIVLSDKTTDKKTVIRGQHSGVVVDATWSQDGILASSSLTGPAGSGDAESSKIVFFNELGENVLATRDCPYGSVTRLQFATSKFVQSGIRAENTLCCIASRKTLVLLNLEDESRSLQYSFKADYGDIVEYTWFGDGYVLLCFQKGVLVWVSSHPDEQGKELQHLNVFQSKIVHMAAMLDGSRFAVCSHSQIKSFQSDLSKMRQAEFAVPDGSHLLKLSWSADATTSTEADYRFLSVKEKQPVRYITHKPHISKTLATSPRGPTER